MRRMAAEEAHGGVLPCCSHDLADHDALLTTGDPHATFLHYPSIDYLSIAADRFVL
jgi:hypothetical protein